MDTEQVSETKGNWEDNGELGSASVYSVEIVNEWKMILNFGKHQNPRSNFICAVYHKCSHF